MDLLNAIILLLNYIFVPALTYGSQLALGAIFVTLIYGILRFANFATGDMMAFGTMVTILITWYFQSIGISLGVLPTALLAIPFAIIFMIGYMLFVDKFVFRYYRVSKSPPVQLAMVSIGVMFVTQAVVRIMDEHKQIVCDLCEFAALGEPKSILSSFVRRRLRVIQNRIGRLYKAWLLAMLKERNGCIRAVVLG